MARKKVQRKSIVSERCFRLLRLKHEIQTDAKVLKAVVDEVDVLRLCRSLGMNVSNEGTRKTRNLFDFGQFNPSDYDADFARFIRERLVFGNGNDEQLVIRCLFGKQLEVKAELTRLGIWSGNCEEGLSGDDQGVYCIENTGGYHRHLVVFAWLDASLFEKKTIRDTPAYVLRFLISLSSNIMCCLSQEDFRHIKEEVDADFGTSSGRWNSCSVAFRVQKQVEQSDSISCGKVSIASMSKGECVKNVVFVGGTFPAIAIESSAHSTTDWISQNDVVLTANFADWLLKKAEIYTVHLPDRPIRPPYVHDDLLVKFGQFPDEELSNLRTKFHEELETAKQRILNEGFEYGEQMYDDAFQYASMLFAVRHPGISSEMDLAFRRYNDFLQNLYNSGISVDKNSEEYKMLYLPDRIQSNMKLLDCTLLCHRLAFNDVIGAIVRDDPINTEDSYRVWLTGIIQDARNAFVRWWRSNHEFSKKIRYLMENCHQHSLQSTWMTAVNYVVALLQTKTMEQRIQQAIQNCEAQVDSGVKTIVDAAFNRLREHLNKAGEGKLGLRSRE